MKEEQIPLKVIFRQFDKDCDNLIDKKEFEKMLDTLKVEGVSSQSDKDFLLSTIDYGNNGRVSEAELSAFLNGESVCDVIKIIERMRRMIRERRLDVDALYREIDTDRSNTIQFREFDNLLAKSQINLQPIEKDEVFRFMDKSGRDSIAYNDFVSILDASSHFSPTEYNPQYFKNLSKKAQEFY